MDEALELGTEDGTVEACRESASRFDIDRTLDLCEEIYERAVSG
jgi:hypothetical protein